MKIIACKMFTIQIDLTLKQDRDDLAIKIPNELKLDRIMNPSLMAISVSTYSGYFSLIFKVVRS